MKNIAVLIDYTDEAKIALTQASRLVEKVNGKLFGIHIATSITDLSKEQENLNAFMKANCTSSFECIVTQGNLVSASQEALHKISADLVIACTHGVKGIFQQLFGAQILKLVQGLSYPALVISAQTKEDISQSKEILFPVGPHPYFQTKIEQTAAYAKATNAKVTIYEINRPGADYDNITQKNIDATKAYFDAHQISYTRVLEEVNVISVGFFKQTIDYAKKHGIATISVMATVSKNDVLFGSGDKENFLVNDSGIAILTCNK
jgi:hypothetical protein